MTHQPTLAIWFEDLKDLNGKAFLLAVRDLRRTSKFFPSIAEIRETARKHEGAGSGLKELPIETISPERQKNNINQIQALIKGRGRKLGGTK